MIQISHACLPLAKYRSPLWAKSSQPWTDCSAFGALYLEESWINLKIINHEHLWCRAGYLSSADVKWESGKQKEASCCVTGMLGWTFGEQYLSGLSLIQRTGTSRLCVHYMQGAPRFQLWALIVSWLHAPSSSQYNKVIRLVTTTTQMMHSSNNNVTGWI